jgi:hypothetical protein
MPTTVSQALPGIPDLTPNPFDLSISEIVHFVFLTQSITAFQKQQIDELLLRKHYSTADLDQLDRLIEGLVTNQILAI